MEKGTCRRTYERKRRCSQRCSYEGDTAKTRPLQLLVPFEVKEPDLQFEESEDSVKTKPKRMAATNADIIRKLCS